MSNFTSTSLGVGTTHNSMLAIMMDVWTSQFLIADSSHDGYDDATVKKILKAKRAKSVRAPMTAKAFNKWLND